MDEFDNELAKRLFEFATRVIKFQRSMNYDPESKTIRYQLTKSSGSSGANYEEAQAGSSRADFYHKVKISLREMKESNYWLRLIKASEIKCESNELNRLIQESKELKLILGSIAKKSRI